MTDALFTDTHADLVLRAKKWLRSKGCRVVLGELSALVSTGEIPDAIAWHGGHGNKTVLIECKTSRADFLADRKKRFRAEPERGMGAYRYFMCPPGVIRVADLPERWGLLYCHGRKITQEAGRVLRAYHPEDPWLFPERNHDGEASMLVSVINRLGLSLGAAELDRLAHLPFDKRQAEILAKATA